ncbi:hypothetical protein [Glutamicibacter arilaitensis]|uniref:hypothetical protein n=1 Tax=Glutamicibacter arilaitensis TaxID=256701 RepID=UPI00385054C5
MMLARLIEPTSKADTIRVLDETSAPPPSLRTHSRSLHRCYDKDYKDYKDYKDTLSKAPYDLQEHFDTKGNRFANGQILESKRVMCTGAKGRERRVNYRWSVKRFRTDNRYINLIERRAMDIAEGTSQMRKARFVKTTGMKPAVDEARIERAHVLAGLKGYRDQCRAVIDERSAGP